MTDVKVVMKNLRKQQAAEERAKRQRHKGRTGMAQHKNVPKCGAKRRDGKKCQQPAGMGTDHYGIGSCKHHGGSTPTHVMAAAKEEMRMLLGRPVDTNPYEAIMTCIRIRAGEVQWLSEKMAELSEQDWIENTLVGKQFHIFAKERQAGMDALVRYSQIAISLNISERAVKLAESYAESIALLLRGVMEAIMPYVTPEGQAMLPRIMRQQLLKLEGIEVPLDETIDAEVVREEAA